MRESDRKLAEAFQEAGLGDFARRAAVGEFNEFFGDHATPMTYLVMAMGDVGTPASLNIRKRIMAGEFDASKEESEEWAASAEGQEMMNSLIRKR